MAEDRKRQLQAGSVKPHHPLMEIVASRLLGIEGVPLAEQKRMVNRAARDAVQWHEAEVERLEAELARLQDALPTTADGVPVVPAMELWCHQEGWRTPLHFTALAFDSTLLGVWQHGQYILFERSYASEAAARAAKETSDAR